MSLEGIWKSRGYGWILRIHPIGYALYDTVPGQCIEFERGSRDEFDYGFEILSAPEDPVLSLRVRNDITAYEFVRVDEVPPKCLALDAPRRVDPLETLEFFCTVFAADYAFFKLRGVDWQSVCQHARSHITTTSSADQLFSVLHEMIRPLADNHVMLSDGRRNVNSEKIADLKRLIRHELGLEDSAIGNPLNICRIGAFANQEFLAGAARQAGNGGVLWGMLDNRVAYLGILRLFGLADRPATARASDLPLRRPDHARFLGDDLEAVESILDQALDELGSAQALVFDVRLNGGGFDRVGMAIANRFADRRRLAFTKHARDGEGVTARQEFYIQPAAGRRFTGPVYLLTSARTASAGDVFALSMRTLPQVTVVGQPSTGILSDNLRKHLPNGWVTSISNEFYCSAEGQLFEGPGVPVDVPTPVFVEGDFRAGYHLAVDKALELAHSRLARESRNGSGKP